MLRLLEEVVRNKPENINEQDVNGDTALHLACRYFHLGYFERVKGRIEGDNGVDLFFIPAFMLRDCNADPTIKNNKGETPLDYVPNLEDYRSLYEKYFMEDEEEEDDGEDSSDDG